MQAQITESLCSVSLWPLGLFISGHFHHMDFILLELQKTQTKSNGCCVPKSVVLLGYKQKILEVWSLLIFAGVSLGEKWVVGAV